MQTSITFYGIGVVSLTCMLYCSTSFTYRTSKRLQLYSHETMDCFRPAYETYRCILSTNGYLPLSSNRHHPTRHNHSLNIPSRCYYYYTEPNMRPYITRYSHLTHIDRAPLHQQHYCFHNTHRTHTHEYL